MKKEKLQIVLESIRNDSVKNTAKLYGVDPRLVSTWKALFKKNNDIYAQ